MTSIGAVTSVLVLLTIFTDRVVAAPAANSSVVWLTAICPETKLSPSPRPISAGEVVSILLAAPELGCVAALELAADELGLGSNGELPPPPQAESNRLRNAALTIVVVFRVRMVSS